MALTADQLADMQMDLQIGSAEEVFTGDQLNRFYTRASSDYNTAIYYAWRAILADAAKFIDYRVAHTEMKKSQVYDHIKNMVMFWQTEARTASNQVMIVGARGVPPRWKDKPSTAVVGLTRRALQNPP